MSISFSQIRPAFDTLLCTTSGITATGSTRNFIAENSTFDFSKIADWGTKVYVRSTFKHNAAAVATLGVGGTVRYSGIYVIDLFGRLDKGYATVTTLFDAILAKITPGTFITLSGGAKVVVLNAGPSPNIALGAYNVGGLYAQQIIVEWEIYAVP
jgi:hypothetical protein